MKKALAILLVSILAISISACNVIIPTDTKLTTSTIASTTSSTNQNKPSDSPNDSFDVSEGLAELFKSWGYEQLADRARRDYFDSLLKWYKRLKKSEHKKEFKL